MAEGTHTEDSKHTIDPEKRKYIRLVQVGLAVWLAVCPAMMLADMYGFRHIIGQMAGLMVIIGGIIMAIGIDGWEKLRERRRAEKQEPKPPKSFPL